MKSRGQGSIRLSACGVDLYLHWSWVLVAALAIWQRKKAYSSPVWAVLEYLALFFIVLLHEYGHALACRQVGGKAKKIVLWPFGGAAYIAPPMRPGATLWSMAAGPLVNVALFAAFSLAMILSGALSWAATMPNLNTFVRAVWIINMGLLTFNLLPIYPLDGGQILRSLLWFVTGRARSLMVVVVTGFLGGAAFLTMAWRNRRFGSQPWRPSAGAMLERTEAGTGTIAAFDLRRKIGFACPSCKAEPPRGKFWRCEQCNHEFDTFQEHAICPKCAAQFESTQCMDCGKWQALTDWLVPA